MPVQMPDPGFPGEPLQPAVPEPEIAPPEAPEELPPIDPGPVPESDPRPHDSIPSDN